MTRAFSFTSFGRPLRVLAASIALGFTATTAQAQALKLGHETPPTHVWHKISEKIAADLEKASEGKMKTTIGPLNKFGNPAQLVNLMQAGAVQIGLFTVAGLANREESLLAWSLPYVFKDVEHASRATKTPAARQMLKNLESSGLVALGYGFAGMRHVLSVDPVNSPADLKNRKIRAFPSPIFNDWWTANGAAPTALPLSEVAPSLTTKLLDAVDIDLDALVGLKLYQQASNLTMTNHMAFPCVIAVSKKWFDGLAEPQRESVRKVIADAEAWGFQTAIDADVSNLAKAKADGVKPAEFDVKAFESVAKQIRDKYDAKNPLIADFHKQAGAL